MCRGESLFWDQPIGQFPLSLTGLITSFSSFSCSSFLLTQFHGTCPWIHVFFWSLELFNEILFILELFLFICLRVCVSLWGYMYVSSSALRGHHISWGWSNRQLCAGGQTEVLWEGREWNFALNIMFFSPTVSVVILLFHFSHFVVAMVSWLHWFFYLCGLEAHGPLQDVISSSLVTHKCTVFKCWSLVL